MNHTIKSLREKSGDNKIVQTLADKFRISIGTVRRYLNDISNSPGWFASHINELLGDGPKPLASDTVSEETDDDEAKVEVETVDDGQLDLFKIFGEHGQVLVNETYRLRTEQLTLRHEEAKKCISICKKLHEEGRNSPEWLLQTMTSSNPQIIDLRQQVVNTILVCERAKLEYLATGLRLSGVWPPQPLVED